MNLTKVHDFDVIEADRATFAQAEALVEKANAEKIGGFTDWVLPDTQTLRALATLAPSLHWCWSSSPYVGVSNNACGVNFDNGNVYYSDRNDNDAVCLVRASQCLAIGQAGQLESLKQAGILAEKPVQREPLPPEWINDCVREAEETTAPDSDFGCFEWLVRKVEAAHGIKENT